MNFYPYEFARFAYQWNHGKTSKEAVERSEKLTPNGPCYTYIATIEAPRSRRNGVWKGCPLGFNVLGKAATAKRCGKDYFAKRWDVRWKHDGKTTMDHTSKKIRAGSASLTKKTTPTW